MTRDQKMMAARRSLLKILPRDTLERLSRFDRPHMFTTPELIQKSSEQWDLQEVKDAIDQVFRRTDPEGTQT
jgi:hypothetical protein